MENQKEIAKRLDNAAEIADMNELPPATSKQCWFLAKLILESKSFEILDDYILNPLTKSEASSWIEYFLENQKA